MPISNYPKGFAGGVSIRGIPLLSAYGGNVFWVDSGTGSNGNKGTFDRPFATIDYATGRCTADNGDIILAKPGHVETVIAAAGLALDVAGITVVFLGSGSNQAYVTFTTDVGADMDVDAASITLVNPKFVAGIDALSGPINLNAADFTIINGEYHDATDISTTDCFVGVADAIRFCLDGWKYFKSNEGGTQKESHIQLNGNDDCILRNLHVEGDFDTGIIENVTDEVLRITMEDHYLKNTDPGNAPCATLDSACSGWAARLNWRNANGTVVDDVADINWAPDAVGYTTDGYSGQPIGTALGTQLPASFSLLDMVRGKKVTRAAADVFDGTQTPLFTVSGGRVCVKCLIGEVSVAAIDAGASNTSLVTNPTVGTDTAMCAVLDINADENGTIYAVTGNPASALQGGSGGGSSCMDRCFIVPEGTIDLLSAADVGVGGALGAFDIWYIPIDTGATITST